MAASLSAELADFIHSGVSILVGTRDARLFPECLRGQGARVEKGRREVTVFLPVAVAERTVANLDDNGRVAVVFSRIEDHRTFQLKGRVVARRAGDEEDRAVVERYRCDFSRNLGVVGVPARIARRLTAWPCHAVRFRVEAVFRQTPGPGAGAPLDPPPATAARETR
jgi:hypothetical protein